MQYQQTLILWFIIFLLIIFLFSSQPEYKVADPICTFVFSVLVIGTTFPVTKDVLRILMEGKHTFLCMWWHYNCKSFSLFYGQWVFYLCVSAGAPQDINSNTVRELLLSVRGIVAVHSLHAWSLNMTQALLSVHVVTGKINNANLNSTQPECRGCGGSLTSLYTIIRQISSYTHTDEGVSLCGNSLQREFKWINLITQRKCLCLCPQRKMLIRRSSSWRQQSSCALSFVSPASQSKWSVTVTPLTVQRL